MLVIRLLRIGRKHQPSYKIVVTDNRRPPKGGRFVAQVGSWNPLTKQRMLDKEQIKVWLSKGAKPSDTVHNMLVQEGVLEAKKLDVHKKSKKKEAAKPAEAPKAEAKPAESAPEPVEPEEKKEEVPKPEEEPAEDKKEEKPEEPKDVDKKA